MTGAPVDPAPTTAEPLPLGHEFKDCAADRCPGGHFTCHYYNYLTGTLCLKPTTAHAQPSGKEGR